jgi:hypothetical protein
MSDPFEVSPTSTSQIVPEQTPKSCLKKQAARINLHTMILPMSPEPNNFSMLDISPEKVRNNPSSSPNLIFLNSPTQLEVHSSPAIAFSNATYAGSPVQSPTVSRLLLIKEK